MSWSAGHLQVIYSTDLDPADYDKAWLDERASESDTEDENGDYIEHFDDLPDTAQWDLLRDENENWFWSEWENLNETLDGSIIAIRDVGCWDGRRFGVAEIGDNLRNILDDTIATQADYEWYVGEDGDVHQTTIHHDGRNHTRYRLVKDWDAMYDALDERLADSDLRSQEEYILANSESIWPYIAEIWGCPV